MQRIPVLSSNLNEVGYDPETKLLEIKFNSGSVYQYEGVPESSYNDMMKATSHGKYFAQYIKGFYPYKKV